MFKKFDKRKLLAVICGGVLLAGYLGGFLKILLDDANVDLNPIHCMAAGSDQYQRQDVDIIFHSNSLISDGSCDLSGTGESTSG